MEQGAGAWFLLVEQSKLGTTEGCQALLSEHHTQDPPVLILPMAL